MNKKIISLLLSFVLLLSVACPVAFADSDTATHTHTWVDTAVSFDMEVCGFSVKINVKKCDGCGWYLHTANVVGLQFSYPSVHSLRALDGELIDALTSFVVRALGSNANLKQYQPGGGSAGTGGVGRRPSGYSENNKPDVSNTGLLHFYAPVTGWTRSIYSVSKCAFWTSDRITDIEVPSANASGTVFPSSVSSGSYVMAVCAFTAPVSGTYSTLPGNVIGKYRYVRSNKWYINEYISSSATGSYAKGDSAWLVAWASAACSTYAYDAEGYGVDIYAAPLESTIKPSNSITINQNVWNGNIYQDNSTNLTYIYPQYTTINERERHHHQYQQQPHHLQQRNQAILHLRYRNQQLLLYHLRSAHPVALA